MYVPARSLSNDSLQRFNMAAIPAEGGFLERTRGARKVMVLDLGFLGDTVHLLPALWMVRQAYPQAKLHAAVADHVLSLMACVPWVDQAWGYPRFPTHATLRQNLQMVARLRQERFDVLINLNGSDRSSWLTFLSGAPARLGRRPKDGGPPFWGRMFTEFIQYYAPAEPVYVQKCRCLEQAGFPFTQAEFHPQIDPANLQAAGITTADAGRYFHLSPFTTADKKELPPEQLAELISVLEGRFPEQRWVLSGAPTEREREKMEALLGGLQRKPWRVFAGDLNLLQLAAVIQHSAAHLCGDTGTLHLALMTGAPSVSWFRSGAGTSAWIPLGNRHRTVLGDEGVEGSYLGGVDTAEVVRAVEAVLGTPGPASH
jgi:ADP-heptose:LPS heptosyltransferase